MSAADEDDWQRALQRIEEEDELRTGHLSLAELTVDRIPDVVAAMGWLESVDVSHTLVSDLSPLSALSALAKLNCSDTEVSSLSPLSGLNMLAELNCNRTQVSDLIPLSNLTTLVELNCQGTRVRDLSPLSGLSALTELNCEGAQVSDLSPLLGLNSLARLNIGDTLVSDLSPLSGLSRLTNLNFNNTRVNDLSPLSDVYTLTTLDFSFTQVGDLFPLSGLSKLATLDCSYTTVNSLLPLSGLMALVNLDCQRTNVSDLSPLSNLSALAELNCQDTRVSDLTPLSSLSSLVGLNCRNTQVSDLSPLSGLSVLAELELGATQVSDLSPLSGLSSLATLYFADTQVSDLSPLSRLSRLADLNFNGTQVSDLSPLEGMSALTSLTCSSTQVSDLSPLSGLNALDWLDCDYLVIKQSHEAFWHNPGLDRVDLNGAVLGTVPQDILGLDCLPRLRDYFRSLGDGLVERRAAKLFLLGNGSVGKTQIGRRLRGLDFDATHRTTHGIDVHHLVRTSEKGPLALSLWDFGGQPLYHGTHNLFLRGGSIYLLVWAPGHEAGETRDAHGLVHRNLPLRYWAAVARQTAGQGSAVLIVETRVDDGERGSLNLPVSDADTGWCEWRQVLNVGSKSGRGFGTLEAAIAEAAEWMLAQSGRAIIAVGWERVVSAVAALRGSVRTMAREDFEDLCRENDVEQGYDTMLFYLNATGELFYRPGMFGDAVVIDQNWMLDAIYALFERAEVFGKLQAAQGRFRRADLAAWLWDGQGHGEEEQRLFLSWMSECGLCFAQDRYAWGETIYIAPAALPSFDAMRTAQATSWQERDADLVARYAVDLLHPGIVHSVIARFGREMGLDADYWDRGVKLYDAGSGVRLRVECKRADEGAGWGGEIRVEVQCAAGSAMARGEELLAAGQRLVEEVLTKAGLPANPVEGQPARFIKGEDVPGLGELTRATPVVEEKEAASAARPDPAHVMLVIGIDSDLNQLTLGKLMTLCVVVDIPPDDQPSDQMEIGRQRSVILRWAQRENQLLALRAGLDAMLPTKR